MRWPIPAPFAFGDIAKLLKSLLRHNESVHRSWPSFHSLAG